MARSTLLFDFLVGQKEKDNVTSWVLYLRTTSHAPRAPPPLPRQYTPCPRIASLSVPRRTSPRERRRVLFVPAERRPNESCTRPVAAFACPLSHYTPPPAASLLVPTPRHPICSRLPPVRSHTALHSVLYHHRLTHSHSVAAIARTPRPRYLILPPSLAFPSLLAPASPPSFRRFPPRSQFDDVFPSRWSRERTAPAFTVGALLAARGRLATRQRLFRRRVTARCVHAGAQSSALLVVLELADGATADDADADAGEQWRDEEQRFPSRK